MASAADPKIVQEIRRIASAGDNVVVTRTAEEYLLLISAHPDH